MDLIQYYANLVAQLTHEVGVLKVTLEKKDKEIEALKGETKKALKEKEE